MMEVSTHWAKIYIAGPIEVAKQILRRECFKGGLCITVEPTTYMYRWGEEAGYVVGLVNYPRFPAEVDEIDAMADRLTRVLLDETYQGSAMYMTPTTTKWITKRGD